MTTFDQPIRSFLTAAASDSPTPGGGSVAALVAALGASMTSMVASLTQGAKFAEVEAEMQTLAREMNFAESTFVLPAEQPGHAARVRIFTPGLEMPMAGHPTVGTGLVLLERGVLRGDQPRHSHHLQWQTVSRHAG